MYYIYPSSLITSTLLFRFCNNCDSLTKHTFPCILPWCFLVVQSHWDITLAHHESAQLCCLYNSPGVFSGPALLGLSMSLPHPAAFQGLSCLLQAQGCEISWQEHEEEVCFLYLSPLSWQWPGDPDKSSSLYQRRWMFSSGDMKEDTAGLVYMAVYMWTLMKPLLFPQKGRGSLLLDLNSA